MKAKMRIEFKRAPIFTVTCIALLGLLGFLGYRFIIGGDYLLTSLVALMSAVIPLFLISRFFHGIRISERRVLIISQDSFKSFKTDKISSLTVTFDGDAVKAEACEGDGHRYSFIWFDCASDELFEEVKSSFATFDFVKVEKAPLPSPAEIVEEDRTKE